MIQIKIPITAAMGKRTRATQMSRSIVFWVRLTRTSEASSKVSAAFHPGVGVGVGVGGIGVGVSVGVGVGCWGTKLTVIVE